MPISAILFDFVGVLLVPAAQAAPDPLVDALDARIGRVTDDAAFRRAALRDFALDGVGFDALLERVVEKYAPFAPLWELLPALRRHFRLGVINNGTWLTYPRFNQRFHLDETFDLFLSSAKEGLRKPDPRIYRLACQKLGLRPAECLFMDDSLENARAAAQVGMDSLHWETPQTGFPLFLNRLKQSTGLDFKRGDA